MQLDYRIPDARLRALLSVHALMSGVDAAQDEIVPAMLANLHIRLEGSSRYQFGDAPPIEGPRVALIGPTSAAYRVMMQPGLTLLATGFLPIGWMVVAGVSAGEVRDTLTDGADIWGARAVDDLCDDLVRARSTAARCGLVERFLMARMRVRDSGRLSALAAVDRWIETSPGLELGELTQTLGIGERHLRRLTLDTHGASPKTLAMKYRSLRAAAALSAKGAHGNEDALSMFADQAHLIRDFRRFVGCTPTAFIGRPQIAAASTLRGRREAGAGRPLILLS